MQHAITGIPNSCGALAQVGVGFGLQAKAQGPELTALGWCVELQQGPRRCHLAGHGLAPAGGGTNQPGAVVVAESQDSIAWPQGLLPARQQWIQSLRRGLKAFAQLAIEQGPSDLGHLQTFGAGPAAAQGAWGVRCADHQRHLAGEILQAAAVFFVVEQGLPAGLHMAGFQPPHHRQPAAAGRQAQGPALQMGPPAQVITQFCWAAG